jgi:hypothetical protein
MNVLIALPAGEDWDAAIEAAASAADGVSLPDGSPFDLADAAEALNAAWDRHGRTGTPRVVGYFQPCSDAEAVRDTVAAFELAGATELVAVPSTTESEELDLLAIALTPALVC